MEYLRHREYMEYLRHRKMPASDVICSFGFITLKEPNSLKEVRKYFNTGKSTLR
jgi:hypothetical protein